MSIIDKKGFSIITFETPLKKLFQDFYKKTQPANLEEAIKYFSIFGGLESIKSISAEPYDIIKDEVLSCYKNLNYEISDITQNDTIYHAVLSGVALGDGRTHSTFKRARVSEEEGDEAVNFLVENGFLYKEFAHEHAQREIHLIADKLHFTSPFLKFYFTCVSPLFQGIKIGDFSEVEKRFHSREQEFIQETFKKLSYEVVKERFESSDKITQIGSYWDKEIELDLYAETASGKIIVGACKYTNAKVKKSTLTELLEKCKQVGIEPDAVVLISKNGFSSELKKLKNEKLMLLSLKNFKSLVE